MYAKDLSLFLHSQLSETLSYEDTLVRFEKLRSYGQLPVGRENAAQRLTNVEIACAILGFVPTRIEWAGHVALIMGDLQPVGSLEASFQRSASLKEAMASLLLDGAHLKAVISVTLSIARSHGNDEYQAKILFSERGERKAASYVSKYATSLTRSGAEKSFDHDRPTSTNTRQLILSQEFFRKLKREVDLSRHLNIPLATDWREYKTEEEQKEFHTRLGARNNSRFLNLGVDTSVTWPKDPTRIEFGGHNFVLFPKTKDNSHSISIDLHRERISVEEARTLLNRFLSLLAWCDDRHAILRDGWSGNPVPVTIPRRDKGFMTMSKWMFYRTMPKDEALLNCLSYYREGLNAGEAGIASQEALSFFKVFEMKREADKVKKWIAAAFDESIEDVDKNLIERFHKARQNIPIEDYIYLN